MNDDPNGLRAKISEIQVTIEKLNLLSQDLHSALETISHRSSTSSRDAERREEVAEAVDNQEPVVNPSFSINEHALQPSSNVQQSPHQSHIRIPKLELPSFRGEPLKWFEFWALFRSAIHEQPHLTDVEKLTYLFSCLKGEARRVVEGFTIEDNNYQLVIDTLNCVYGNKQALSRHLHRQLRQLHCQSHSASDLLRYHTDVDRILKHMANADISYENAHVLFDIEEGLPEETRLIIHQEQKKYPVWTTTLLRKTILDTSQMLQSVKIPQSSSSGNQVLHSKFPSNKKSSAMISLTARAPQNASQRGNLNTDPSKHSAVNQRRITSNPKSPCCFCGELHWNIACNKYKTVDQRRHRASILKICFKCLTPGHVVAECPKKPCYICKGNHNQALCYQSRKYVF